MKMYSSQKNPGKRQRKNLLKIIGGVIILVGWILADDNFLQSQRLFNDHQVASIYITINPDSLAWILASQNLNSDRYFRADLRYLSADLDTTISDVGLRLRGNTSRYSQKKSFKISFDEFQDGRRFFGLKKMNLNGEHNDPSIIRSKLCWDLFEKMGVPGSRAVHVRLYLNGHYRGLYIHVEDYDKTFLQSRFSENDGNLYKCLWPADLAYLGNDPEAYKYASSGRRAYELQTNATEDDYSDLAHLISIINKSNSADFADSLYAHFDIWNFLKYLAVNVAVGSWDDYWYNQNNFFLYNNLKTGQFEWLGYDYDNTFGIWWGDYDHYDWGTRDIFSWGVSGSRPLTDRILDNQQFKTLYSFFIREFVQRYFNAEFLFPYIDSLKARIDSAAEADTYRTLDYGYSLEDFNDSYSNPIMTSRSTHVKYGLKQYISTRGANILIQANPVNVAPFFVTTPTVSFNALGQAIITVEIFDEKQPAVVLLRYRNQEWFESINLQMIAERSDRSFTIYRYQTTLPDRLVESELQFYFSAIDVTNQTGLFPFAAPQNLLRLSFPETRSRIVLNEILASNATTNADEYSEYDDWIEIYCPSDSVNLEGYYLTDNLTIPDKWAFPDTLILSGAHLLIWADDQPEQGRWHMPFKLDKGGEELAIFHKTDTIFLLIDSLTYGTQTSDISYGRIPDGGVDWSGMPPSPGSANSTNSIRKNFSEPIGFTVYQNYPNPFNGQTKIAYYLPQSAIVEIAIIDLAGRIIRKFTPLNCHAGNNSFDLRLDDFSSGIYFLKISAGNEQRLLKCAMVK
jgi:spore coat protein CotH